MSFRDWGRYTSAVVLFVVAIAAAGQLVVSVWSQFNDARYQYREYENDAKTKQALAVEDIGKRCSTTAIDSQSLRDCIAKEVYSYEAQDRIDKDLQAQQDVAFWTFWTVIVGTAGLSISAIGLWALLRSLHQTKVAITNDREIGNAQVRAYLAIDPKRPSDISVGKPFSADLSLTNTGQSPAYNVRYIATIVFARHPITNDDIKAAEIDFFDDDGGITIPSGGSTFGKATSHRALEKAEKESAVEGGPIRIYFLGAVAYNDVFGHSHITRCAALLDFVEGPKLDSTGRVGRIANWLMADIHNEAT